MEVKQPQTVTTPKNAQKISVFQGLFDFVGDVKQEFHQITWTPKDELRVYTQITVIGTFVFGLGIYFADLLIQGSLDALTWLSRLITG